MAFWKREGARGQVRVWVYVGGRKKRLPRSEICHLDTEADSNIDYEIGNIARKYEVGRAQAVGVEVTDWAVQRLVKEFLEHQGTKAERDDKTLSMHKRNLLRYALPFLTQGEPPVRDPNLWVARMYPMYDHLVSIKCSASTIRTVNVSIRVFWTYLFNRGIVRTSEPLRLQEPAGSGKSKTTSLARPVTPDEVLTFAATDGLDPRVRRMALLGYFFSLRPQELCALTPGDFRAEPGLECAKVMKQLELYGGLQVNVHRQLSSGKENFKVPKAHSKGMVACFDKSAAREILKLWQGMKPGERLFPNGLDYSYHLWKDDGIAGISLKDLRRSSIYWLANYTEMKSSQLQLHARHRYGATTELYYRRPEEKVVSLDRVITLADLPDDDD